MLHTPITAQRRLVPDHAPLDLAVVIPIHGGADAALALLERLETVLAALTWEAILVAAPEDGTAQALRIVARRNIRVRVLPRLPRQDTAAALVAGMLATAAPVLAVIEPDRRDDAALLVRLCAWVRGGACDLAVGSHRIAGGDRALAGGPTFEGEWGERIARATRRLRRGAAVLADRITGTPLSDPWSGLFAISRLAFEASRPRLAGGGCRPLLDLAAAAPKPLRIVELPCRAPARSDDGGRFGLAPDLRFGLGLVHLVLGRALGRWLPTGLVVFLLVGGLGLGVYHAVHAVLVALGFLFTPAQALAAWAATTLVFVLHNLVLAPGRGLSGRKWFAGLGSFYAVCGIGAAATGVFADAQTGWASGLAGLAVGAVWVYAASGALTWRG